MHYQSSYLMTQKRKNRCMVGSRNKQTTAQSLDPSRLGYADHTARCWRTRKKEWLNTVASGRTLGAAPSVLGAARLVPSKTTRSLLPCFIHMEPPQHMLAIEVMENEYWRIRWPVEVYGFIAARDTVDQNRNLLFSRTRDDPQILTPQDPFLQLTGPCRPIWLIDPVDFEIQLKVKGSTESEDETFMAQRFVYGHGFGQSGHLARRCWEGNFCTLEITSALLCSTVAATIISADVIQGSWPDDSRGRVVSRTAGIDKDFVLLDSAGIDKDFELLDSGDGPIHVDADGHINLQRGVVCVRRAGMLTVSMEAYSEDKMTAAAHVEFRPKKIPSRVSVLATLASAR